MIYEEGNRNTPINTQFMRTHRSIFAVTVTMVACLGAPAVYADTPVPLQTQAVNLTGLATASSGTVQATAHHAIDVPPGCVMYLQPLLSAAGVGTSNNTFSFSGTLDGITWTTATNPYPVTAVMPCTGTTPNSQVVAVGTNLPYRMVSFDALTTTQTNVVTVTSLKVLFVPASPHYAIPIGTAGSVIR